ncbi:MAG: hypothetical protein QM747_02980 [Nocardioides sp.]
MADSSGDAAPVARHRGQQPVLLGRGDPERTGHRLVERVPTVVVENQANAGQLAGGLPPGRDDGLVVTQRPVHQLVLEVARQSGVPTQVEGAEQGQLVAEGLADALGVHGKQPVAPYVDELDHAAEGLPAVVEGGPGHGRLLSGEPRQAFHIPSVRTQSMCNPYQRQTIPA